MTLPWWLVAIYGAVVASLAYGAGDRGWNPYAWVRSRLRRQRPPARSLNLVSFDGMMKDMYALPGTQLKQWVVDQRRENAWMLETCPRFMMKPHDDNTGAPCREGGIHARWYHLEGHDCCSTCNEEAEARRSHPEVVAWLAAKAARPPIETDHAKLSDQIEPPWMPMREHPVFKMLKRSP